MDEFSIERDKNGIEHLVKNSRTHCGKDALHGESTPTYGDKNSSSAPIKKSWNTYPLVGRKCEICEKEKASF